MNEPDAWKSYADKIQALMASDPDTVPTETFIHMHNEGQKLIDNGVLNDPIAHETLKECMKALNRIIGIRIMKGL